MILNIFRKSNVLAVGSAAAAVLVFFNAQAVVAQTVVSDPLPYEATYLGQCNANDAGSDGLSGFSVIEPCTCANDTTIVEFTYDYNATSAVRYDIRFGLIARSNGVDYNVYQSCLDETVVGGANAFADADGDGDCGDLIAGAFSSVVQVELSCDPLGTGSIPADFSLTPVLDWAPSARQNKGGRFEGPKCNPGVGGDPFAGISIPGPAQITVGKISTGDVGTFDFQVSNLFAPDYVANCSGPADSTQVASAITTATDGTLALNSESYLINAVDEPIVLTESAQSGWVLDNISCTLDGVAVAGTFDPVARSLTLPGGTLVQGDGLICVLENSALPNNPPVAVDDIFTTSWNTSVGGNVLLSNGNAADSDPEGDAITVTAAPVVGPVNGTVVLGTDGVFTYTPNPGFFGTDSFEYQITDTFGNTATATVVVTVASAVVVVASDVVGPVNGLTGGDDVANVLEDNTNGADTIGGVAATPLTAVVSLVSPATPIAGGPVPTLDTADGAIDVPAGTPAGIYTISYELCEILNPTNCGTATVTVTVAAPEIVAQDDSVVGVNGSLGAAAVLDVFANNGNGGDTYNGAPAAVGTVTLSVVTPAVTLGGPVPALNAVTGLVDVPAGTPAGVYTITYEICDPLNPMNCTQATISVTVAAPVIVASDDALTGVNGYTGATGVLSVFADNGSGADTINGNQTSDGEAFVTTITAPVAINGGNVPVLNADGTVDVPAGTTAGDYTLVYALCETLNPTNCDQASITISVDAPSIVANDDTVAGVDGIVGQVGVVNILADNSSGFDLLNGVPALVADVDITVVTAAAGVTVPTLDPATGDVDVPVGTPAGTYTIVYQLCDGLNDHLSPQNCDTATVTVTVSLPEITALAGTPTSIPPNTVGDTVVTVLGDDEFNGGAATLATVTITAPLAGDIINRNPTAPAFAPGDIVLDPLTGEITIADTAPAGVYEITYEICDAVNPANCSTAVETVAVLPLALEALPESLLPINGADGGSTISVVTSDIVESAEALPLLAAGAIFIQPPDAGDITDSSGAPVSFISLDVVSGVITVAPGTPAGDYNVTYTICVTSDPANCSEETELVRVVAPDLVVQDDVVAGVNGLTGATGVVDIFANNGNGADTLNGAIATLTTTDLTVIAAATPINGGPVPTLDAATGLVDVPAGTPAGIYTISYEVCEILNPTNCGTATVTVSVDAAELIVQPDVVSGVDGLTGATGVVDIFADNGNGEDTLNGMITSPAATTVTVTAAADPINGGPVPVLNPVTGLVDVPAGTPAGTYTISYEVCEILNPTNCGTATVVVTVASAVVVVASDVVGPVNGLTGGDDVANVLEDNTNGADTIGGVAATPLTAVVSLVSPATPIAGGPVPTLDTADGAIDVPAGTPAGIYTISYELCEILNPTNCGTATVTVTVAAAALIVQPDAVADVDGLTGATGVVDIFANNGNGEDTLNGAIATLTTTELTVIIRATPINGGPVPTLDAATGLVDVPAGTPAGIYTISYELCEILNPTNCGTATVTVSVRSVLVAGAEADRVFSQSTAAQDAGSVLDSVNDTINGVPATLTNVALTQIAVVPGVSFDPTTGNITIDADTGPGTYTVTYRIADLADPLNFAEATETVIVVAPQLALVESISGVEDTNGNGIFGDAGDTVNYTYTVENTGDTSLAGVMIDDTGFGGVPGIETFTPDPLFDGDLAPGEGIVTVGTATYVITPDDVIAGEIRTQPTVTAIAVETGPGNVPLPGVPLLDGFGNQLAPVTDVGDAGSGSILDRATGTVTTVSDPAAEGTGDDVMVLLLQSAGEFLLTKTTRSEQVLIGETISYEIVATSLMASDFAPVQIIDTLPEGLVFVPGSATIAGVVATPVVAGQTVSFPGLTMPANASLTITLQARVSASAAPGALTNVVNLIDELTGEPLAAAAAATVSRTVESVFDCSAVIGKVFDDVNMDGYQDAVADVRAHISNQDIFVDKLGGGGKLAGAQATPQGEVGIPNVRLVTPSGTIITTDAFGRFSVPCAELPAQIGTNFMLKVDTRSLPTGYRMTTENPRVMRLTSGMMTEMNFGAALGRVFDVDLSGRAFAAGATAPSAALISGLERVLRQIADTPTVIRIAYYRDQETSDLAHARLNAIEEVINEEWRDIGNYRLLVEKTLKQLQ